MKTSQRKPFGEFLGEIYQVNFLKNAIKDTGKSERCVKNYNNHISQVNFVSVHGCNKHADVKYLLQSVNVLQS